jgi:uncharacterized protein (DUF1778 family)
MRRRRITVVANTPSRGQINIRLDSRQQGLIDLAAHTVGKSRTEFILDASRQAAEMVLLDRTIMVLDEEDYGHFVEMLDNPPAPTSALRELLSGPTTWE